MGKKKKKCTTVTKQTAFLAYQSGTDNKEVMMQVFGCIGRLTTALAKKRIRLYTVIQTGIPPLCGLPGQPKCP